MSPVNLSTGFTCGGVPPRLTEPNNLQSPAHSPHRQVPANTDRQPFSRRPAAPHQQPPKKGDR